MATKALSRSAKVVQEALARQGLPCEVVELPDTTRSARDAAEAIGCDVGEIAKSLIFRNITDNTAVLVIASGNNRVDETKIGRIIGAPIEMASPEFVRERTGFAIGGVPPLGHKVSIETLIDEDLAQFETIWAAAGTPFSVFAVEPQALISATRGTVTNVRP